MAADSTARAGGYGLYNEGELTKSKIDTVIPFNNPTDVTRDFEQGMWGIGLSYDSNIARDEPFNYRFKVGFRLGKRDYDDDEEIVIPRETDSQDPDEIPLRFKPETKTLNGFTFHQTLGYGLLRDESYRFWVGPSMRLNVDWQNIITNLDTIDVSVGGGPELGINYHINKRISLSGSIAYNFMYLSQSFETTGEDRDFDGYQHLLGITFTVFWRTEDDFFERNRN